MRQETEGFRCLEVKMLDVFKLVGLSNHFKIVTKI